MPVIKAAWRRWKRPSRRTIRTILASMLVALGIAGMLIAQQTPEQDTRTQLGSTAPEDQQTTTSDQVIIDTDPNSLPFDDEDGRISFGVTVYTDIKLDGRGGGLQAVVWECPPGHTPMTGGCASRPPDQPVPGCLTWGTHFVDRHDNVVCNGAPHVFPTLSIFITGADGVPHWVNDWTPVWPGAQPWECLPRPTFTVRTREDATYPACLPTPTPRPTATPTPTPRPTPTPSGPSPTPITCPTGYSSCPSQWYCSGDPSCGCYWTRPNCCPPGWHCQIHFYWFTCYNMGCCTETGCDSEEGFMTYKQMADRGIFVYGDDGKPLN